MTIEELIVELKKINQRLLEGYDLDDRRVRILARTTKISEEVGELANELLADLELQRKDKMQYFKSENIAKELVDVLFTALILGITLDIDLEKAIKDRLNDINNRVHI
ncbi:hypothetical protein A3B57_03730 [Microgenomates group bacterium RIFCSPLOWO2_01_FULL_47_10]|nr:MAG: hypothetical protein A3B57_03730 [Microgenomates group bacterium RIFCSPLOWO2_01_FULL_47_10]